MTNKITPCQILKQKNFPPLKQLPGNILNYLSTKDIGINFDCDKRGEVYPIGEGIVIDVIEESLISKSLDHYQKFYRNVRLPTL